MANVIYKQAGADPQVIECDMALETLQGIVGGYIEVFPMVENLIAICDEEGKQKEKEPNTLVGGEMLVGDIIICKTEGEEMVGLSDDDIKMLLAGFVKVEQIELSDEEFAAMMAQIILRKAFRGQLEQSLN